MKRKLRGKVLFVAQDAGGFNSLVPVIRKFRQRKSAEVRVLLRGASLKIAREGRIRHEDGTRMGEAEVRAYVSGANPAVIVTGTSGGPSIDKWAIMVAKEAKIPTVAVIDFWINYNIRFNFTNDSSLDDRLMPDRILVMDGVAKTEMIEQGFPRDRIIVTGNPHFDAFKVLPWRRVAATPLILFVDQPISESIAAGWHEDYGYTELQVFKDFLACLERLKLKARVVVKLHPRTASGKEYQEIAKDFRTEVSLEQGSHESLLRRADLVFGMTSILLFEAAIVGKRVVSYQPGLSKRDPLIANRLGLTTFVTERKELEPSIRAALRKSAASLKAKVRKLYLGRNATGNVVREIGKLMHS
jgi:hypothetical protein